MCLVKPVYKKWVSTYFWLYTVAYTLTDKCINVRKRVRVLEMSTVHGNLSKYTNAKSSYFSII